jgi:hypothetical protein
MSEAAAEEESLKPTTQDTKYPIDAVTDYFVSAIGPASKPKRRNFK